MEENRRNSLAGGTEVLVGGGGNVFKWIEISVPSPTPPPSIGTNSSEDDECVWLPSNEDYASSSVLGEPPIYFIWRINKTRPNALEILQLSAKSGFPITRLRFVFDHTLSPFAVVYTYEGSDPLVFFVYALTSSGAIYVLRVSNTSAYKSGSAFPLDHLIHLDAGPHLNENRVTSVAASPGYLFLGRSDGCVSCFQPVVYFQRSSGFHQELRLDTGFGRLWGFVRHVFYW
ncbi:PREDICTED: nuclear pore complex protein NUP160-like [Camelina sativa]|uniref:Nuclear pore complex protein NUP160-like n=1 Tax=Camelina sativa TaxID=90675 RepID=A0ABM1QIW3_CAMSA|nr:PREDICTED: nuclear pore complex protein NUP160-like [Camelina sativa]